MNIKSCTRAYQLFKIINGIYTKTEDIMPYLQILPRWEKGLSFLQSFPLLITTDNRMSGMILGCYYVPNITCKISKFLGKIFLHAENLLHWRLMT